MREKIAMPRLKDLMKYKRLTDFKRCGLPLLLAVLMTVGGAWRGVAQTKGGAALNEYSAGPRSSEEFSA